MRISDWSSDVCSSDLSRRGEVGRSDQACGIVGVIGLGVAERPEQDCVLKTALGTKRIEIDPCRGRTRNAAEVAGLRNKRIHRTEARRVGNESVSTCRYRWSPEHKQKTVIEK